ncbi:MAG: cytochrome P450 [Cyanobacteria bacterium J06598_3]
MVKLEASRPAPDKPSKPLQKPTGYGLFRQLEWILDPVTYLERTKIQSPDFFEEDVLGFGTGPVVVTSHPDAMQYILSRDRTAFSAPGEFNSILAPVIGNASVIMLSGERHKERRQLVTPAFHGERLAVYGQIICDLAEQACASMTPNTAFSARTLAQQVSLQIISQVVFGLGQSPRSQKIMDVLTETVDTFSSPKAAVMLFFKSLQKDLGAWSPWGQFVRLRDQLDTLVYEEIRDRAAHPDPARTDILSMLMAARTESGDALDEQELRDELMALLMAGHETTATAIAWALYWIHKTPGVKAKLLTELSTLGTNASPTAIAQLPYLSALCQETLRRSPVTMFTFPRVAQTTVELMGHTFTPGTTFLGCMFLTHQREDLYPDPKAFRPERFLDRKFSPYEFIAFGNGARRCIGAALAQYEMKLAVATLITGYDFKLASDKPEKAKRRGVTLAPGKGVPMIFTGKRAS